MQVLLTGGTGFVGSELARSLLMEPGLERLVLLVRPLPGMSGAERWRQMQEYWTKYLPVPPASAQQKVEVIEHDLTRQQHPNLPSGIQYVIHAAAATDLSLPLAVSRRENLYTTQKALGLARRCPNLRRFVHFSTAYVAGCRRGRIKEDDRRPSRFHNFYESSKLESEDAVRASDLPYTILRPSIIVGRSDNGYVYRMKVLYSVWRIWLAGVIPRAPLDPRSWVDIVPIDFVVAATLALMREPKALGMAVHLCAGEDRQSPAHIMRVAATVFGVPLPPLSPPWVVDLLRSRPVRPFLAHDLRETLDKMHNHVPYIGMRRRVFDMSRAEGLLAPHGVRCPKFADYGEALFRFCLDSSWGKRRLVNERSLARAAEDLCTVSA